MSKLINVFYGVAIAIAMMMAAVSLMLLPEYQPPDWVGYTVIAAVGVFMGAGCILALYSSVTSYGRNK